MRIHFYKYQATGNDFVLIDNRAGTYALTPEQIETICDRKFGVGADGLMLLEQHPEADFHLRYYNSDGSQSLCGNGSRAAVNLAASLGIAQGKTRFEAFDGLHEAELGKADIVRLRMNDVTSVAEHGDDVFIDTGSPHFIRFVDDVEAYPVVEEGRKIRYSSDFAPGGTNVNFIERRDNNTLFVRTYERGVEDETLSCGTGVTAAALAASIHGYKSPVAITTKGGELQVEFTAGGRPVSADLSASASDAPAVFRNIYLIGPAKLVFEGDLEL